jgi:ubiquinone/menaquinone biosynthesis C-methylase UbiE
MNYDAELERLHAVFRQAWGIRRDDHVLDVGCGTGQTSREAARMASLGRVLGVDIAEQMVVRAREMAEAAGPRNLAFAVGDAQVYPFTHERFDVVLSRFGTMFFDAPVAAFTNIARALRPEGRLVMLVWQAHEQNAWSVAIERALDAGEVPRGPDPFSLGEQPTTTAILEAAGFEQATFTDVHAPVFYGADVETALDWVRGFSSTREALEHVDVNQAVARLRDLLAAHLTETGVWFEARAWIVEATKRRGAEADSTTRTMCVLLIAMNGMCCSSSSSIMTALVMATNVSA